MARHQLIFNLAILSSSDTGGLVVACSGGLDSIALLHGLAASAAARQRGLRALHVHHGLHADADAWAMHCQHVCDALDVPLRIARVLVDHDNGDGPEAAARAARHSAFAAEIGDGEVLALAHHRDDQAETFLLRALRASGPDGLGAMRPWRRFGRGWLWRPLLDMPRAQLLAYAQDHGLHWIDDPGNDDSRFDRNFLRHHVMPLLRGRWPHVDAAFARSAALSGEAAALLDGEDACALADVRHDDPHALDVARLIQLPAARRARVLRRWIAESGLPPLPGEGIARIEHALLPAAADRVAEFAWHGAVIRRWRNLLHAGRQHAALPRDWTLHWNGRDPASLPGGGTLVLEGAGQFDATLRLGARRGGERITLPGRRHSHALKHVLQDLGIPPWQRARLPLLCSDDGEVLAAGDVVYSAGFDAWLRDRDARLHWSPGPD